MAARSEQPLQRMHHNLNTLFDRLWRGWLGPMDRDFGSMRLWDFGVTENDKEVVVRAEMPGFEEKEVNIEINNDVLTIKAEKEDSGAGEEEYHSFFRSMTLPAGTNADNAKANYRNGVLELHIPRVEGAKPKRIKVEGSHEHGGNGSQSAKTSSGTSSSQASGESQTAKSSGAATGSEKSKK
jgi:HSP20 family protein